MKKKVFIVSLIIILAISAISFQQFARRFLPVFTNPESPCVRGSIYYHMLTNKALICTNLGIQEFVVGSGGGGGGISSLNGLASTSQTFSATDDTNIDLAINSASSTHNFTLTWTGLLAKNRMASSTVHTDQANTFGAFAQIFQAGTLFNLTDTTDVSKVARFDLSNISTSTIRSINIPNASSTTVQSSSAPSNNFASGISSQGIITYAQPAFSNLSGSATDAQISDTLSISSISNLTTNGFIKTGSSNGTLSIDTNTYLIGNQTITLSGSIAGSGSTSISTTIANNVINGSMLAMGSDVQGDIIYYNGTDYVRLGAGINGQFLKTQGAGANPIWATIGGGGDALVANPLSQFASTTSAQFMGVISNETGSGLVVANDTPILIAPIISNTSLAPTPTLGKLYVDTDDSKLYYAKDGSTFGEVFIAGLSLVNLTSNVTGTLPVASGGTGITSLGTGISTWWGTPNSSNLRSALTDENGTGVDLFDSATSPTFITSLLTSSTTFALLNSTATTINFAGATTTLNIGASATMILNFGGSTSSAEFRYLEPSGSGTNYSAFKAQAQSANITYTLPSTVASAGQVLTDVAGNGTLSWTTVSGGGGTTINSTDTVIPYRSNSTTFADSPLSRLDANTIEQRNSTNQQTYKLYGSDSGSNDSWLDINSNSGSAAAHIFTMRSGSGAGMVLYIGTESTDDDIIFRVNGTSRWTLKNSSDNFAFVPFSTYSLGTSSSPIGTIFRDKTITAGGTTGAQTINKASGTVNFAASATTLVVTNSLVSSNSIITAQARTNDTTCSVKDVEATSGSFTIRMNAACTAETSVGFTVTP